MKERTTLYRKRQLDCYGYCGLATLLQSPVRGAGTASKRVRRARLKCGGSSYDSTAALHNFAERKGIHFPLLSDPNSKLVRALGILNETVAKASPQYGIPHIGVFVLVAKGVIGAKYFEDDYRRRYRRRIGSSVFDNRVAVFVGCFRSLSL